MLIMNTNSFNPCSQPPSTLQYVFKIQFNCPHSRGRHEQTGLGPKFEIFGNFVTILGITMSSDERCIQIGTDMLGIDS